MGDQLPQKCCPMLRSLNSEPSVIANDASTSKRTEVSFTGQILSKIRIWKRCHNCTQKFQDTSSNRKLLKSLFYATEVVDHIANDMYTEGQYECRKNLLGHDFSVSRVACDHGEGSQNIVHSMKSWLQAHEEAQVMLASVLVVVGLWWLVRTVLSLVINLVCPLLVVLMAVVLVPQLRAPLLGQNYPALANVLRTILIKMAENINTKD